jgi:hypothetical protein
MNEIVKIVVGRWYLVKKNVSISENSRWSLVDGI